MRIRDLIDALEREAATRGDDLPVWGYNGVEEHGPIVRLEFEADDTWVDDDGERYGNVAHLDIIGGGDSRP